MGHHGHSAFLSFQWNSWLSETVSNCLLNHLTPSFLEHHHGFQNWCSGQLFILVYRSDDLMNNQGLVFSLQWCDSKKEENIKLLCLELLDIFLKHCLGKNELKHIFQWWSWYSSYFTDNVSSVQTIIKGRSSTVFLKLQYIFLLPWIKLLREFASLVHLQS